MSKDAWCYCTLVTTDSFVIGAQVLILSLLKHSALPDVDVVVLHTDTVSKLSLKVLQKLSPRVRLRRVGKIEAPAHHNRTVPSWGDYTKLRIWELVDYARVLYLDADMLVMDSIDHLFSKDLGDLKLAAAPDVYPPDKFNAGLLLIQPGQALFDSLLATVGSIASYDGGDTGFLNAHFPEWYSAPEGNRLPFAYNAQRTLYWMTHNSQPGYWEAVGPIKVLHFSSSPKPWDAPDRKGDLEMIWWTTYAELAGRKV